MSLRAPPHGKLEDQEVGAGQTRLPDGLAKEWTQQPNDSWEQIYEKTHNQYHVIIFFSSYT